MGIVVYAMQNEHLSGDKKGGASMNPQKIAQQVLAFQKLSFENLQSAWQLSQTQTSNTVDRLMDQVFWVPRESRQMLENWRLVMKKDRERVAAFINRGFTICDDLLASSQAPSTVQKNKTKTAKQGGTDGNEKSATAND